MTDIRPELVGLPKRLYWVDLLRGCAACSIVVFHYHHFYLRDASDRPNIPPTSEFPYASLIGPLYQPEAAYAVQLFWIISGVVFLHVYGTKKVDLRNFAVARLARLYPLHFATLLVVAALQLSSLSYAGHWQVYGSNDLRHFLLHSVFASNSLTLNQGLSFNGPIWSVSAEIPVYFIFLLVLAPIRRQPVASIAVATLCALVLSSSYVDLPAIRPLVFTCAAYFFTGCLIYHLMTVAKARPVPILMILGASVAVALAGTLLARPGLTVAGVAGGIVILTLSAEHFFPPRRTRNTLGDISYAVYLVHVPLQILFLFVLDLFFAGSRAPAQSYWLLPAYFSLTLIVATAAHYRFELPVGRMLQKRLGKTDLKTN